MNFHEIGGYVRESTHRHLRDRRERESVGTIIIAVTIVIYFDVRTRYCIATQSFLFKILPQNQVSFDTNSLCDCDLCKY